MKKKALVLLVGTLAAAAVFTGCNADTTESSVSQEVSEVSSDIIVSEPESSVPSQEKSEEPISSESSEAEPIQETPTQNTTVEQNSYNTYNEQVYTPQEEVDPYADWVPYHTSSLETLADVIAKGYVVYHNGQYLASPYFANMLANEKVVYCYDVSSNTELVDRYAARDLE